MRLRSLESRIVIVFLLLILAVQLAGLQAVRDSVQQNARARTSTELDLGEKLFLKLLGHNTEELVQRTALLAANGKFQQAIEDKDAGAIAAVLTRYRGATGATLTAVINPDHRMQLVSPDQAVLKLERTLLPLTADADQDGRATTITRLGSQLLQIAVVPIKVPNMLGWVATGFPISQHLSTELRGLMPLQVSVLSGDNQNNWLTDTSTLNEAEARSLLPQLRGKAGETLAQAEVSIGGEASLARVFRIAQDSEQTSIVVLQRPLQPAVAPFEQLQLVLLLLTLVGIGLALVGSALSARRITQPLRKLTESARRLGNGDYYRDEIELQRDDEIGDLSRAFDSMRNGIANRELEIRRLAYWDSLTGLPNRAQFVALLDSALERARKHQTSCHVLMMDLDRFKHVNDVLGHSFGDALLQQVAQRLRALKFKSSDQVARLGGDEFAVLLPDSRRDEAQTVAAHILATLEQPIALDDQTIDLGASIGIAGFPEHGTDTETLLRHVDVAMYAAKSSGNEAVVYDAAIDRTGQESLSLLGGLRRALEHGEFRLYMQPKIMLATGKIVGAEALIRWLHPKKGLIQPDDFIPFAEKTGFIRALTRWVLEQAAISIGIWQRQGIELKISVNLSTRDLLDQDLPAKFMAILARHQVASASFCLEITESAIMNDPVRALQTLNRLFAMGVQLSIDDFGTGYSSLAYLKRLPVHELKIDKSFVMNMEYDSNDATIVRSTIDLGHNMGLRVVAEGIESQAAQQLLGSMGCNQGQGYFISKPMPVEALPDWVRTWRAPAFPDDNMI